MYFFQLHFDYFYCFLPIRCFIYKSLTLRHSIEYFLTLHSLLLKLFLTYFLFVCHLFISYFFIYFSLLSHLYISKTFNGVFPGNPLILCGSCKRGGDTGFTQHGEQMFAVNTVVVIVVVIVV